MLGWTAPRFTPGTQKLEQLDENLGAAEVKLTPAELREMDRAFSKITVQGARLSEDHMKLINR
jgi:aryl-alcohol dehydrogenase-like predicted oxidoreductase